MNVFEAGVTLFEWFGENDSFSLSDDFIKMVTVVENPDRDRAAVACALDNLEKMEVVQSSSVEGNKVWVLCRSYASIEQTLTLSAPVANEVASVINSFCDNANVETEYCDPSCLKEKDISNLLFICSFLSSPPEEEQEGGEEIQGFSVEK